MKNALLLLLLVLPIYADPETVSVNKDSKLCALSCSNEEKKPSILLQLPPEIDVMIIERIIADLTTKNAFALLQSINTLPKKWRQTARDLFFKELQKISLWSIQPYWDHILTVPHEIQHIVHSPDKKYIVEWKKNGNKTIFNLWNIKSKDKQTIIGDFDVIKAKFRTHNELYVVTSKQNIQILDCRMGKGLEPIIDLPTQPRTICFNNEKDRLFVGLENGCIGIYDYKDRWQFLEEISLDNENEAITSLCVNQSSTCLFAGSNEGTVYLWGHEVQKGWQLILSKVMPISLQTISSIFLSPDEQVVYTVFPRNQKNSRSILMRWLPFAGIIPINKAESEPYNILGFVPNAQKENRALFTNRGLLYCRDIYSKGCQKIIIPKECEKGSLFFSRGECPNPIMCSKNKENSTRIHVPTSGKFNFTLPILHINRLVKAGCWNKIEALVKKKSINPQVKDYGIEYLKLQRSAA